MLTRVTLCRAPLSFAALALLAGSLSSCAPAAQTPPAPLPSSPTEAPAPPPSREGDFARSIPSLAFWDALSYRSPTAPLAGTEVVKVILDRSDGSLYFLQSERWPLHYTFARRFLARADAPIADEATFNQREYHSPDRRFILATVSRYPGDVWAMELYAGDALDLDQTAAAFERVKGAVFFADKLRYRPVPLAHDEDPRTRQRLPVVETKALFGHITYQPLELGEAHGFLRIIDENTPYDGTKLRPYDIVVLAKLPEDIPVVAGVITDELQAPLGHINVLCHNRATPNMALRGASIDPALRALEGKLVKLTVGPQSHSISPSTQIEAEASWQAKRPAQPLTLTRDDRDIGLPVLTELHASDVPRVGAKAAQLGEVARMKTSVFRVPAGFVLPMHAYARFLTANGLDKRIDAMLTDSAFLTDPAVRARALDALRADIEKAPVPASILSALKKRLAEVIPQGAVRFRSSTNAEDLPSFNGAGLYRSVRVEGRSDEALTRALRQVWASVWLPGAHEERSYYRIDSGHVGMAILVQESVEDDVLNGVAVTVNPFNQGQPGFFVNAQRSGDSASVTGARGDEIPEQVLIYDFEGGRGVERLSTSSRAGGKPLLTPGDLGKLTEALTMIHGELTGDPSGMSGEAVDVEFLIAGPSRTLAIVQARPFTMRWTAERRWLDDRGQPLAPTPRLLAPRPEHLGALRPRRLHRSSRGARWLGGHRR